MFDQDSFWQLLASESCAFLGEPGVSLGLAGLGGGGGGTLGNTAWACSPEPEPLRGVGRQVAPLQVHWGPLYTRDGWGCGCSCVCCFISKKRKREREKKRQIWMKWWVFLFPLFFLSYKAHEKCSFFSFQILNVKTQLKPDSTAFYRNTQPSVTLGS